MPRKKKRKAFLLHPTRRQIFKVICENPGAYFYNLAADLSTENISSGTLSYHLKKLEESGIIQSEKMDGKRVYFPRKLRSRAAEKMYLILRNDNAEKIFQYIINNEGCYQNEIAREIESHHDTVRYHVEKLEEEGLIRREKERKKVRFYIGPRGQELLNGSLNVLTQQFVDFVASKLKSECGAHIIQVLEQDKKHVTMRINCPGEDDITLAIELHDWEIEKSEEIDDDEE